MTAAITANMTNHTIVTPEALILIKTAKTPVATYSQNQFPKVPSTVQHMKNPTNNRE